MAKKDEDFGVALFQLFLMLPVMLGGIAMLCLIVYAVIATIF